MPSIFTTLRCSDARATMTFLVEAFGFEVLAVHPDPDRGPVRHAELRLGDDLLMLGDEPAPGEEGRLQVETGPAFVYLAFASDQVRARHEAALAAGAEELQPYTQLEYGSSSTVRAHGHVWSLGDYRGGA